MARYSTALWKTACTRPRKSLQSGSQAGGATDVRARSSCLFLTVCRQGAMLASDEDDEHEPDADESHVQQGELAEAEAQIVETNEYHTRLKEITCPPEERVDGLLGFVFRFAARRQKQRVACGVLDRIVGTVLENLRDADDAEDRNKRDRQIAAERDQREHEKRAAHADRFEHARD